MTTANSGKRSVVLDQYRTANSCDRRQIWRHHLANLQLKAFINILLVILYCSVDMTVAGMLLFHSITTSNICVLLLVVTYIVLVGLLYRVSTIIFCVRAVLHKFKCAFSFTASTVHISRTKSYFKVYGNTQTQTVLFVLYGPLWERRAVETGRALDEGVLSCVVPNISDDESKVPSQNTAEFTTKLWQFNSTSSVWLWKAFEQGSHCVAQRLIFFRTEVMRTL